MCARDLATHRGAGNFYIQECSLVREAERQSESENERKAEGKSRPLKAPIVNIINFIIFIARFVNIHIIIK